jgi:aspartate/methionine/tyrosine aminotransferase
MTSLEFTNRLFDKTGIVVAAGTAYGKYGEGYVRISPRFPTTAWPRPWVESRGNSGYRKGLSWK